ncbi:MAG: hypothetical protein AAFY38_14945 [Pseudomonadota bacterium]
MITWRSSLALAALLLAGCAEGSAPAFLKGGSAPEATAPLREAALARGAVRLVAPSGYCIDADALGPRFAAMARCDTLGGADGGGVDRPLALITISLARGNGEAPPVPGGSEMLERRNGDNMTLLRLRGAALDDGFDDVSWRGYGQVGQFAVGLAAYGPEGGQITGEAGARLLTGVMANLQSAAPRDPAVETPATDAPNPRRRRENGLLTRLAGLFD